MLGQLFFLLHQRHGGQCHGGHWGRLQGWEQAVAMPFDQAGVEVCGGKWFACHQPLQEADIAGQPNDLVLGQCLCHVRQGAITILAPDDQLGDHRVVKRGNRIALAHAGIDPDNRFAALCNTAQFKFHGGRGAQVMQRANRWQKAFFRVFGVNPRFQRMAIDLQLLAGFSARAVRQRRAIAIRPNRGR